ncbi:unnamed protein product [Adineta steineri]|uniref:Uncharacterized protein n=1 Tax=Adineta steineri TaxID=433720 RepID=A0A815LVW0_9BILA|nr:unnamed protein product [Adineta steineri]CAF1415946.1 unnamed protein product [Adineta steineri]CAF1437343.1 unnamed protein product [Adineta steineri]
MLRILVIILLIAFNQIESVTIEYPSNGHIKERIREDINSIDKIFRYYIVPREIQFHADALQDRLPYFLQCKGTKNSVKFTVPPAATDHLALNTEYSSNTITATLRRNQFRPELVGRYTCSETINDKIVETSVYVFIQDGTTVFTKRLYPKVLQQTGVHFFNLPCQTTSWYPRMSCPTPTDPSQCKILECNSKQRQVNELKCNIPVCTGQEICIPVYYTPADLKPSKVFFDPQIGFALENPTIPNSLIQFTCMSNYTPSQISRIPFDTFDPDHIEIHQPSLNVMPDETVRLSCEIQYGSKMNSKNPSIFWFDDIYDLNLVANETEKAVFNPLTQVYSRNSSITLRGFKSDKVYRFYCVRVSEQGIYSRSVEITCVSVPSLDLEISSNGLDTDKSVSYGSDSSYDITIFTIPRSKIVLEITRNGVPLTNDKRFELLPVTDRENQFYDYTLTIYNVTFEDETDIKIHAKSSALEKSKIIKPSVTGNPVGQFSFVPNEIPRDIPWRDDNYKTKLNLYTYGIYQRESYRVVCTVRHRSDIERSLNVFIQHSVCTVDNCLSDIIDRTCQSSTNQRLPTTKATRINNFQTQFVSIESQTINDPSMGHQYICCYEQNGIFILAKALTVLARNRNMFIVHKPEFSLVTGDVLKYRCESHDLVYDDVRMIYNDGLFTYERNRFDPEWRLIGTNQAKQVDIEWSSPTSEYILDTAVELKTPPLRKIGKNGFFQCTAISKRSDVIPSMNDTYMINVDDPVQLQFKTNLPAVSKIDRKSGTNVDFDCSYDGRPQPKIVWWKGKVPLISDDSTLQFRDNNGSIHITRAQASDTGYYTCELTNGRDPNLSRSFDLRVKGPSVSTRYRRLTNIFIIISACLILLLLVLLIIVVIKYIKMKQLVGKSVFHAEQSNEPEDKSQPPMTQLTRIPLPDNFASTAQVRTLLGLVNNETSRGVKDDFKELGHGQFGVVYQVRLPEVGLVAAKLLPESIRNTTERRHDKRKKSDDFEESLEMLEKKEIQKKKAAEMLIDEIKVMHKAGKHINIVSLLKVAYPETKFKYLITGGLIRDEDSFYLMELCSNGSLESMLKRFLQPSKNSSHDKLSLYETLAKQNDPGMTLEQAHESCILTDDDLKLAAYQVASGVDYLNRRQIAHCDIAARNVLVSSRFIMKICDFGLATYTTYKSYREQLAQHETVQLEKKNNELATHNLTPELARAFLRASTPDERLLLNKSSLKSDVWSFGIFLWTLFLKCQIRPFNKLLEEMQNKNDGESFFHRLARVVSEGRVLKYIDYQKEIPGNIYAIIRDCLVEENDRPEMTRIRALLCHSKMLSKQAFEYYRSEYNRYQEENAADENVLRFGEDQGVSDLPSFNADNNSDENYISANVRQNNKDVTFRPPANDYYATASDGTSHTYLSQSDKDYPEQRDDSYLIPVKDNNTNKQQQPRTIVGNVSSVQNPLLKPTNESNIPRVGIKTRAPLKPSASPPSTKRDDSGDSYV